MQLNEMIGNKKVVRTLYKYRNRKFNMADYEVKIIIDIFHLKSHRNLK